MNANATVTDRPDDFGDFDAADLTPREKHLKIAGVPHVLREASAAAYTAWRNAALRGTRMRLDGHVDPGDAADADNVLLSACLFTVSEGPHGRTLTQVPVTTIRGWNQRTVGRMLEWVQRASGMIREEPPETEAVILARIKGDQAKLARVRAAANGTGEANGNGAPVSAPEGTDPNGVPPPCGATSSP